MKVFKFGGASVKDADAVRNMVEIVRANTDGGLFVVVSAMGKTTNALEGVMESFYKGYPNRFVKLQEVVDFHNLIIARLWGHRCLPDQVAFLYNELEALLTDDPATRSYEQWYDSIVGYGELISTSIIASYLDYIGIESRWVDMRRTFVTNNRFRDANVDIDRSAPRLLEEVERAEGAVCVGQGFIGATPDSQTTTLGREGSDYSAAVAGNILNAESVTIWKDVRGILNCDPKLFENTIFIPELTYSDAIELAHSGAQIIHPKTIKPLQNKQIPLYVRCFSDPSLAGSVIRGDGRHKIGVPVLILKRDQVLISFKPDDFSFILEERFAEIFALLEKYHVKINLIQSSAINLTLSIDRSRYLDDIVEEFTAKGFSVKYNDNMELLTVRGYTESEHKLYAETDNVYLSQRTRRNLRVVRKVE